MSNIVSFKDVSLSFGGVKALSNVSFDIKEGSLQAIIGPNGAGKTSIFNCISGIYKPTEGHVEFKGKNIDGLRPDEIANMGVARTFQNIELFENMTVLDNILIGAHRHIDYGSISGILFGPNVRKKEVEARKIAEDIIDFLEIEEYRYSYILSLPYGIQKRIELAERMSKALEDAGKEVIMVGSIHQSHDQLLGMGIDAAVITACPRLAIEDGPTWPMPLLTVPETQIVLGRIKPDPYPFDEFA